MNQAIPRAIPHYGINKFQTCYLIIYMWHFEAPHRRVLYYEWPKRDGRTIVFRFIHMNIGTSKWALTFHKKVRHHFNWLYIWRRLPLHPHVAFQRACTAWSSRSHMDGAPMTRRLSCTFRATDIIKMHAWNYISKID